MDRPPPAHDPAVTDRWHVVAPAGTACATTLLGEPIEVCADGSVRVAGGGAALAACNAHGYVWASFGTPLALFDIAELAEPDRRTLHAASIGVATSAPRAIENFLDMGHFPFVHDGILGAEPFTEVKDYDVALDEAAGEILATRCRFFQPMAAATSSGGADVDYIYRVPHPFCAVLYKSSGLDPSRNDVIALFVQPTGEESVIAHMLLSLLDDNNDDAAIRRFQQTIFAQDKPILESQWPRRLPLDPRAETPIRADKSSIVYRRWLAALGWRYGVIPAGG
ncbi:aromatic ring-hydroxylating dioxygenase subunit alpha [Acuticoccus sp. MNP-M23]|uniref:aromatic ring-hydroxylating dioxygenase subunit alpha n=1 Tax=Acuticoccus sp. MNP-M23 TaxID=3072793 RepID=UPI0028163BBB|nr:aromatic ring-hydroxylating dioxygenase subunit alpha [Acuticoccus sp. MNP-M23]WMS44717.1 aromatic ring-hydroxylating dioxygenase subunit alpha [Acuticoccus sp. MNP-M23]